MPKRVLMRLGKDPFQPMDLFDSADRDVIGTNSGNMLFAQSVYKTVSADGMEITRHGYTAKARLAEKINANYDLLVLPMANAFRLGWKDNLEAFCDLLERIRIPTVVVGIGAQTDLDYDMEKLAPVRALAKRFVAAVLERSASIGVRGECTATFLRQLGFPSDSIDVIGCPSIFMYGPDLPVLRQPAAFTRDTAISINVTSTHKKGTFRQGLDTMIDIADAHLQKYPRSIVIGQEIRSLRTMLWGTGTGGGTEYDGVSAESMRALAGGRARFFVDPNTWFSHLEGFDFSFGTRLHGNISALLAGTPAVMLATDSRTREIAEYYELPWRRIDELDARTDAADLYAKADFSRYAATHAKRFDTYVRFLKKNGLPCIYDDPARAKAFDARLAAVPLAPGAEGICADPLLGQLYRLRKETQATLNDLERRLAKLEKAAA